MRFLALVLLLATVPAHARDYSNPNFQEAQEAERAAALAESRRQQLIKIKEWHQQNPYDILREEFAGFDLIQEYRKWPFDNKLRTLIVNILPGSQAESAGFRENDQIGWIAVQGQKSTSAANPFINAPYIYDPSPDDVRRAIQAGLDENCQEFRISLTRDDKFYATITLAYPTAYNDFHWGLEAKSKKHKDWLAAHTPDPYKDENQKAYYEQALKKNAASPVLTAQINTPSTPSPEYRISEPSSAFINFLTIVFLSPLLMSAVLSTVAALNGEHKTLTFTPSKFPPLARMPSTRRLYHYIRPFKKFYVMWKIASRPPPPKPKPPPTPQETKAAQNHLKIALAYLEKISSQKLMKEVYETLKAGTKHINDARNLDPAAVYIDPDAKPEFKSDWTCDDLAARALFLEALFDSNHTLSETSWTRALVTIDKALAYRPRFADYHRLKAVILTRLLRREEAYTSINQALELDPYDFDIITTKDRMDADPLIGVRPGWKLESGFVFAVAILTGLLGLYLGFTNNTWYLWLLMVAALIWSYADKVMGFREIIEMNERHADVMAGRKGPHDL